MLRVDNKYSAGKVASLVVSDSPAILYSITVYNSNVGSQYIQIHNAATLPADGVTPEFPPTKLATGETKTIVFGISGRRFKNGIVVCNSSTDSTKTIGAADIMIDAQISPIMV